MAEVGLFEWPELRMMDKMFSTHYNDRFQFLFGVSVVEVEISPLQMELLS